MARVSWWITVKRDQWYPGTAFIDWVVHIVNLSIPAPVDIGRHHTRLSIEHVDAKRLITLIHYLLRSNNARERSAMCPATFMAWYNFICIGRFQLLIKLRTNWTAWITHHVWTVYDCTFELFTAHQRNEIQQTNNQTNITNTNRQVCIFQWVNNFTTLMFWRVFDMWNSNGAVRKMHTREQFDVEGRSDIKGNF